MKVVSTKTEVREQVKQWRKEGLSVGFVPTMGYLHEGHESLVKKAASENDRVVVSIFVNPMQFGPKEDLATYPRDLEADKKLCEAAGAALIFHPEPEEMYDDGFCSFVDMNGLTNALCGISRPVHFRGVCTVVNKLFNIVKPDRAYFGEKDAQQLAVVKRMVSDLDMDIEIVGCPIIREADGLAKSSRNTYLSTEGRREALVLSKAIFAGKQMVLDGERNPEIIKKAMKDIIVAAPMAKIDYVEIVDFKTMKSVEKIEGEILCAIAVYIADEARLIDNFMVTV